MRCFRLLFTAGNREARIALPPSGSARNLAVEGIKMEIGVMAMVEMAPCLRISLNYQCSAANQDETLKRPIGYGSHRAV